MYTIFKLDVPLNSYLCTWDEFTVAVNYVNTETFKTIMNPF